jgi:hypothetical protein
MREFHIIQTKVYIPVEEIEDQSRAVEFVLEGLEHPQVRFAQVKHVDGPVEVDERKFVKEMASTVHLVEGGANAQHSPGS